MFNLKECNYQTFDFLGDTLRDSNSPEKYKLSKLNEMDNFKSCLDIGCNAGYFLFRLNIHDTFKKYVGIDISPKYIKIAEDIKHFFNATNISFSVADIFNYQSSEKFDLIICFSTFHYFNNQKEFLDVCFNFLNDNGVLLLEVEEYPSEKYITCGIVRNAESERTYYLTKNKMKFMIKNSFILMERYPSVKQPGALYDRWFYKLKKI